MERQSFLIAEFQGDVAICADGRIYFNGAENERIEGIEIVERIIARAVDISRADAIIIYIIITLAADDCNVIAVALVVDSVIAVAGVD